MQYYACSWERAIQTSHFMGSVRTTTNAKIKLGRGKKNTDEVDSAYGRALQKVMKHSLSDNKAHVH